jgi:intracellular sulfur oxidation DsrE/DsrF family protein
MLPTTPARFAPSRLGGLVIAAVALLLLPLTGQAQPDDAPRTAYLVRSSDALPVVLMSARTSLTPTDDEAGFTAEAADVVVVGPAVKALAAGSDHADALRESLDAGVRVVACEIAMDKVGVSANDLMDGVDTAPNGFHELFRLQDEGYETLQL